MMGSTLTALTQNRMTGTWAAQVTDAAGKITRVTADHVVSSAAINELVRLLGADDDLAVRRATDGLKYRDFLIIGLIAAARSGSPTIGSTSTIRT